MNVSIGILRKDNLFLVGLRSQKEKHFPLVWEFPGGKAKENEDIYTCLERELDEELGIKIIQARKNYTCLFPYDKSIKLTFIIVEDWKNEPIAKAHEVLIWIPKIAISTLKIINEEMLNATINL